MCSEIGERQDFATTTKKSERGCSPRPVHRIMFTDSLKTFQPPGVRDKKLTEGSPAAQAIVFDLQAVENPLQRRCIPTVGKYWRA